MSENTQELSVTGTEVAGLFDTRNEDLLTLDERVLLSGLLSSGDRVDMAIPDDISEGDLWRTLSICGRVFVPIRRASTQLKIIIGRAINLIQQRPEIFESRGFRSFDDFMSLPHGLQQMTGISRAELFKAKATANALGPTINMEDVRQIGITKIQMVAQYSEPGTPSQDALIEVAKTHTVPQLREHIARLDLQVSTGDMEWDVLQIPATKTQKALFMEFFRNPLVLAYCGTTSQAVVLERMLQECSEEWQIRAMAEMPVEV